MKYLIYLIIVFVSTLSANERWLDEKIDQLKHPEALERTKAVAELSKYEGVGLNWRLRNAWDRGTFLQRVSVISVATFRADPFLLERTLIWNTGYMKPVFLEYIFVLDEDDIKIESVDVRNRLLKYKAAYDFVLKATHNAYTLYKSYYHFYESFINSPHKIKAVYDILDSEEYLLEIIHIALKQPFEVYTTRSFRMNELDANMYMGMKIMRNEEVNQPTIYFDAVRYLRNIQIECLRAIRATKDGSHYEKLIELREYYSTPYPYGGASARSDSTFRSKLDLTLYAIGMNEDYYERLIMRRGVFERNADFLKKSNNPLSVSPSLIYTALSVSQDLVYIEKYEDAIDMLKEVIKYLPDMRGNFPIPVAGNLTSYEQAWYCLMKAYLQMDMHDEFNSTFKEWHKLRNANWISFINSPYFDTVLGLPHITEALEANSSPRIVDQYHQKLRE